MCTFTLLEYCIQILLQVITVECNVTDPCEAQKLTGSILM